MAEILLIHENCTDDYVRANRATYDLLQAVETREEIHARSPLHVEAHYDALREETRNLQALLFGMERHEIPQPQEARPARGAWHGLVDKVKGWRR